MSGPTAGGGTRPGPGGAGGKPKQSTTPSTTSLGLDEDPFADD